MNFQLEEIITRLKKKGLKITPQRLEIYKRVINSTTHPSAEEIHESLKKEHPAISLATVYKTLHLLKEIGMVQDFDSQDGKIHYDPDQKLHFNMICSKCGAITDLNSKILDNSWNLIKNEVLQKIGRNPLGQLLNLYYICSNCDKKN